MAKTGAIDKVQIWLTPLGERPAGPPLAAGDRLLVPTHEPALSPAWSRLHWLGLSDGRQDRALTFEGALISGVRPFRPETSEVSILVATYSADVPGDNGALLALDSGGEELWRRAPGVQGVSAPALVDETVWVTTNTGFLVSLDVATGAEGARIPLGTTPSTSAPLVVADVAYVPGRGPRLLATGLDGERRWEYQAADHPRGWLNQTPLVMGEHLLAVLNRAGRVIALRLADGELAWEVQVGPEGKDLSPPATDGERLYVGGREGLHALDPADGREVWHFPVERGVEAAPVLVGDVVYIACRDHHLYALDAAGGQELWHYGQTERRIEVSPLVTTGPRPLAVIADRGGTITAIQRPLSASEHEAAGNWAEAASAYAALGQRTRAAELLEAHSQAFRAAKLWEEAGHLEKAAGGYEVSEAWGEAAELWGQLDRPLKRAEATEQQARFLTKDKANDEVCADVWKAAAQAFDEAGEPERAEDCRREAARCRRLPYLAVEVEPEKSLVLNNWTRLRFIVHNRGSGPARQLIIRARGDQFVGQLADTRRIITLRAGQTREDWLDVRPLEHGDSVPLRVSIEYQDRTQTPHTWDKTLYLPVAQDRARLPVIPGQRTEPRSVSPAPQPDVPTPGELPDGETKDFFVSYNSADQGWAEWIAWHLEEAGYTTVIQAWDFRPGGNFVLQMQRAAEQARHTIAVLSPNYLNALYTQPEWAAAFAQDPTGEKGTLLPVRVSECELKGLLKSIVYIDLVGLTEKEARVRLLASVVRDRAKPTTAPGFPETVEHIASEQPGFPGEASQL
jgi:outer membrane protein assembly factor BamB